MKTWLRAYFCALALVPVAAEAAADTIPLDDSSFTAYIQQKLQLYSVAPVAVSGPFSVAIASQDGVTVVLKFKSLHDDCEKAPAKCENLTHDYVQQTVRDFTVFASDGNRAPQLAPAVPGDKAGFMAYAAAALGKLLPDAKIETDGFRLNVTRPGGRTVPLDARNDYEACAAVNFRCQGEMDRVLARVSDMLTLPKPVDLRASLHIMASCNVIASVGNSISCAVRPSSEPMASFFRRAFANLEEICVKTLPDGSVLSMTNADRHDLGFDIGEALDLCSKSTHEALGPLGARLSPPASGIGAITAPYAASYALFPVDWSSAAQASGGHLLIAVPTRDMLLYTSGDGPAEIAALSTRTQVEIARSPFPISTDVYRWTGDGWALATTNSTMPAGPRVTTDVMPRAPQ